MADGVVFNIQRFCTDDGPGIRTCVVLKGCPLDCLWCHNPESKRPDPERAGDTVYGQRMSVDKVMAVVERDRPFYARSGGGVTFTGGEPFAQPAFLLELLRAAKAAELHTCVETCGYVSRDVLAEAADFVDLFLYDCKETDPVKHRVFTGVDPARIRANLDWLAETGRPVILRAPIVPGCNDRPDHFHALAALAASHANILRVELEPYHPFGRAKAEALGRDWPLGDVPLPTAEMKSAWARELTVGT